MQHAFSMARGLWLALVLMILGVGQAIAVPTFEPMGFLQNGGTASYGKGISSDGSVAVVNAAIGSQNQSRGRIALWNGATLSDCGAMSIDGNIQSRASSSDGEWIIGSLLPAVGGQFKAVTWQRNVGFAYFADQSGSSAYRFLAAINSDGTRVAGSMNDRAVYWNRQGSLWTREQLELPSGFTTSTASAISADGQVVVGNVYPPGLSIGPSAKWRVGQDVVVLPMLPIAIRTEVVATNHDGSSVVGSSLVSGGGRVGWIWTAADGVVPIPAPNGYYRVFPTCVSEDGSTVLGWMQDNFSYARPFIWSRRMSTRLLDDYLNELGLPSDINGLFVVEAISADGTALTGHAVYNNVQQGGVVRNLPSLCAPDVLGVEIRQPCPGGDLSLTARMAGSGPYQFVWQRDGVALENGPTPHGSVISGSQTMRLQITGCSELDEGQYQLVVTNSCGTGQSATVAVSLCRADANCDGVVDFFDYLDFVQLFAAGSSQADFNQDQILNLFDYLEFVASFASGC